MPEEPRITGHSCFGMIYLTAMGTLWFLVLDYFHADKTKGREQTKFPGGRGIGEEKRSRTLERVLNDDLQEESDSGGLSFWPSDSFEILVPDDTDSHASYQKIFTLIPLSRCDGRLRRDEKEETDQTLLGVPRLVRVDDLAGEDGVLYDSHKVGLAHAIIGLIAQGGHNLSGISQEIIDWAKEVVTHYELKYR